MLKTILNFHKSALAALSKNTKPADIFTLPVREKIARMKYVKEIEQEVENINKDIKLEMNKIIGA